MKTDTDNRALLLLVLIVVVIALIVSSILRHRAFERAGVWFVPTNTTEGKYATTPEAGAGTIINVHSVPTHEEIVENIKRINERNLIIQKTADERKKNIEEIREKYYSKVKEEQAPPAAQNPQQSKKAVVSYKPTQETLDKIKSGEYIGGR